MFEVTAAYDCEFQFVAASTLGRSRLVFIGPYFILPTHPTNAAWDNR